MKKDIFKKAHNLTKGILRKGDNYRATFKLALSFVYSSLKKEFNKITITEKLVNKGYSIWKKGTKKRVYINDISQLAEKFGVEMINPIGYRKVNAYYDCTNDTFYFNCSNGRKATVNKILNAVRA